MAKTTVIAMVPIVQSRKLWLRHIEYRVRITTQTS